MSSSELSASIEETNRIRAAAGLPPLAAPQADVEAAERRELKRKVDEALRAEDVATLDADLKRRRRERAARAQTSGPSLGESLPAVSAAEWATRHKRQKKEAAARAKQLAEADEEEDDDEEEKDAYTSEALAGLKVGHAYEELEEGREVVLTLRDADVLGDGEDELVSEELLERQRQARAEARRKRLAGPVYDVFDDRPGTLLAHYDDDDDDEGRRGAGMRLGDEKVWARLKKLQELEAPTVTSVVQTALLSGGGLGDDGDGDEETTFKKKKKKKQKKKKQKKQKHGAIRRHAAGEDESDNDEEEKKATKVEEEEKTTVAERLAKERDAVGARKKTAAQLSRLVRSSFAGESEDEDEEEDAEEGRLRAALEKARALAAQKKSVTSVAEAVAAARDREDDGNEGEREDDGRLVISETTGFVRGITVEDEAGEDSKDVKMKPALVVKKEKMEVEEEEEEEEEEGEGEMKAQSFSLEPETKHAVAVDVNVSRRGVAGILALAQQRGMAARAQQRETQLGRSADAEFDLDMLRSGRVKLEYRDDEGNLLKPKEAFRHQSHRFHASRPGRKRQEKRKKQLMEMRKQQEKYARLFGDDHAPVPAAPGVAVAAGQKKKSSVEKERKAETTVKKAVKKEKKKDEAGQVQQRAVKTEGALPDRKQKIQFKI